MLNIEDNNCDRPRENQANGGGQLGKFLSNNGCEMVSKAFLKSMNKEIVGILLFRF